MRFSGGNKHADIRTTAQNAKTELVTLALASWNGVMYFFLVGQVSRRHITSQVVSRRPRATKEVHGKWRVRARREHCYFSIDLDIYLATI